MQHELEPLLLSISDAAKSLGISHWTIRHLLRTRQLSRVRIGTRVLISAADLIRFIDERTESAVDEAIQSSTESLPWRKAEILVDQSGI
jgi:excisionase family DNA binding protein